MRRRWKVLDWTADGSCGKHREFLVGWANRVLTNLERWFADRDFVATKGFTVADILMLTPEIASVDLAFGPP